MTTSRLNQQHGGILFAGMMGVVMSASLCFFVLAMPSRLFGALVGHSGLAGLLPAASPPLGANAHMLVAAAAGLLGGMLVSTILLSVENRYLARVSDRRAAQAVAQIRHDFAEGDASEEGWPADDMAGEGMPVLELYDITDQDFDDARDHARMPGFRFLATGEPVEDAAAYEIPVEDQAEDVYPVAETDIPGFLKTGPATVDADFAPVREFGFRKPAQDLAETGEDSAPMFVDFDRLRAGSAGIEPLDLGRWPRISPAAHEAFDAQPEDAEFAEFEPLTPRSEPQMLEPVTFETWSEPRFPADVEGDSSLSALLRRLEAGIEKRGARPFVATPVSAQGAQLRSTLDELRRMASVH